MLSSPITNEAEARAVGLQFALQHLAGKAFVSSDQLLDVADEFYRWIWFRVRDEKKKGTNSLGPG